MKKILSNSIIVLTILFFIVGCSKDDDNNTTTTPLSSVKLLTSFELLTDDNKDLTEDITDVTINKSEKSITATLPYGTDITSLTPNIEVSDGATISPTGPQNFTNPVIYTVIAEDKSKVIYTININVALNDEKQIAAFQFTVANNENLTQDAIAIIDQEAKTITASFLYGTDITSLTPTIEISEGATITPEGAQDFTEPVTYTVTAEDKSEINYEVTAKIGFNDEKQITAYQFTAADNESLIEDTLATIDEEAKTITTTLPYGTDITSLIPTIEISEGATLTPEGAQNFTESVTYTVKAEDETEMNYEVIISLELNDESKMNSFKFLATNNTSLSEDVVATIYEISKTIVIEVSIDTDVTALTPTLEISEGATISPEGTQDFTNAVEYIITAEDGTTESYKTKTNILLTQRDALIAIYNSNPDSRLDWDITTDDISTWRGVTIDEEGFVTSLEVDNKKLTNIPSEIGQLKKLVFLNLRGNKIGSVTPEIWQLTNLTELELGNNGLTTIPIEITQLSKLSILTLSNNGINSIPSAIEKLTNLTELNLGYNHLTALPTEIGQLINLTNLRLDSNQLTSLPNEIGNLNKLISLTLYNNELTSIPSTIGNLDKLQYLIINQNDLISIPNEIGNFTELLYLNLSSNQLTSIPIDIKNLTNLEYLNLHGNNITSLPSEIGDLKSLSTLYLSENNLTSVPIEFWNLNNLEFLSLHTNKLVTIPSKIEQLTKLTSLIISGNNIESIPSEVGNLTNLTSLQLHNNFLTSIPNEIGLLNKLTRFYINSNKLTSIPLEIKNLSSLTYLNLRNNELTTIPSEICDLNISLEIDEGVTCE